MDQYFSVKLDNGSSVDIKAAEELALQLHDSCVFRRDFYTDMGEIVRVITEAPVPPKGQSEIPSALRRAENADLITASENEVKARSAMRTAQSLVESLNLAMKLLNAHYSLDGKLVTIQFSADGRVDFRELVKELSRALCTRIELRQIGVRDETGIYGGIAVCGQPLCCCRFLKEFNSINVKMAKEQDLSLTPSTISGACGRLKCCLKYEHEGYQQLEKTMPRRGEWCDTPQGHGRISDRNLLTQKVSVTLESGSVVQFHRTEITITPPPERSPGASGNRNNARNGGNGSSNDSGREGKNNAAGTEKRDRESRRNAKNNKKRNSGNGNNSNNNSSNGSSNASSQPKQPAPAPAVPAEVPSEPDAGK